MDTTFCTKCVPRELTRRGWTVDRECAVAITAILALLAMSFLKMSRITANKTLRITTNKMFI